MLKPRNQKSSSSASTSTGSSTSSSSSSGWRGMNLPAGGRGGQGEGEADCGLCPPVSHHVCGRMTRQRLYLKTARWVCSLSSPFTKQEKRPKDSVPEEQTGDSCSERGGKYFQAWPGSPPRCLALSQGGRQSPPTPPQPIRNLGGTQGLFLGFQPPTPAGHPC